MLLFSGREIEKTFARKRKKKKVEIKEEIVRKLIVRDGPRIRGR